MQKLIILLITSLFIFSCQSDSQDSNEIDNLAEKRIEFANMMKNSTGAIESKWESSEVLVLTFKPESINKMFESGKERDKNITLEQFTKESAIVYAVFGVGDLGTKVCVKIQYPDGKELAYECRE